MCVYRANQTAKRFLSTLLGKHIKILASLKCGVLLRARAKAPFRVCQPSKNATKHYETLRQTKEPNVDAISFYCLLDQHHDLI